MIVFLSGLPFDRRVMPLNVKAMSVSRRKAVDAWIMVWKKSFLV
jgi:hypothetical protein